MMRPNKSPAQRIRILILKVRAKRKRVKLGRRKPTTNPRRRVRSNKAMRRRPSRQVASTKIKAALLAPAGSKVQKTAKATVDAPSFKNSLFLLICVASRASEALNRAKRHNNLKTLASKLGKVLMANRPKVHKSRKEAGQRVARRIL
jgi:hypothetical protein